MKTTLVCTRKYNKEEYKFFLNEPSYVGEKGVCGIEIEPYVSVETPVNCFGYSDTVLLNRGKAYTLERYLPRWILKKIEKKMLEIMIDAGYVTVNTLIRGDIMIDGYECCYNCEEEFYFNIEPQKSVFITCPHCGTIQHACSLCDNPTDCSGLYCKDSILKSLGKGS